MKVDLLDLLKNDFATTSLLARKGHFVVNDTIGISLLFAGIFKQKPGFYTIVCSSLHNAQLVSNNLASLIGEDNVLLFPSDDLLRSELVSASKEFLAQRLYVMDQLQNTNPKILIVHASSLLLPLPSKSEFVNSSLHLAVGDIVDLTLLKKRLIEMGYLCVNKLDQSFEFASRGDILDVYSVNYDKPIRIELFGDEIDSIKFFDISSHVSLNNIENVCIVPALDTLLNDDEIESFKQKAAEQLNKDRAILGTELAQLERDIVSSDIDVICERKFSPRTYKYYRYIKERPSSILDYIDSEILFFNNYNQCISTIELLYKESTKYFHDLFSEGRLLSHLEMYLNFDEVISSRRHILKSSLLQSMNTDIVFDTRPLILSRQNNKDLAKLIDSYLSFDNKVVFAVSNKQQFEIINTALKERKVDFDVSDTLIVPNSKVAISLFPLEEGFELPNYHLSCVSSVDLFGSRTSNARFFKRFKEAMIVKSYEDFHPGDYVVHEYYGIGKFLDIQTIEIDGIHRDFLHIEYNRGKILYVPLSQFRLVRKYAGREGASPRLSSLDNNEWEKTKSKIKERINLLADRLFKLYSERALAKGFRFQSDDELQANFEKEFPFELTCDQKKAVEEIKHDMESEVAMDRLLCGDVGFGKTEVAFRAIFKAISSGKQAAILCPTTLLARQHYERALERFANFGVKIAIVSRLVPEKMQKEYITGIKDGTIHLIIGTHRLLSKDFEFKNLGLLVVDEEQRFGVEQKEKIKELKSNIDVLSLSATPIPRTLQLSLLGVRPVSTIATAPLERSPIQTYVAPFKKEVARELIERELARNGQVFYVHNTVSTIHHCASQIANAIPSASVGVVHGKMDKDEIEDVMLRFYSGEIDVLVATSIIENGIDIANANLIIIEEADKFGLSQLYQIKGRVGRGNRIAYAYLFYNQFKTMNEDAQKRLKAIQDFAELGSGYKIAQRDLMIRGAGDVLGPQQAGFIDSVGLDLYLKLLNEVVEERKNGVKNEPPKPVKLFSIDAYIPKEYASKEDKIGLYQEIENINTIDELKALKKKARDIYGRMPDEVNLLFDKRKIDILFEQEEFASINEVGETIEVVLSHKFSNINGIGSQLFEALDPYLDKVYVTYLQRVLKLKIKKNGNWMKDIETIAECIHLIYKRNVQKINKE